MRDNDAAESRASVLALAADAQLVEQTMAGRRDAFDELIRRHQRKALAISYRLLGNSHDAAEVTQDAFLKAYASLKTLESPEKFCGWLMRIVSNLSLNRRRGRRRSAQLPADDLLGTTEGSADPETGGTGVQTGRADDPYQQLEGKELGGRLMEALEKLPEKQRVAIVMFTIEGMPQKDIAEALDCSVEAVKWHVFQGRKKLRETLRDLLTEQ
jgi:RNA polymerase sigma-70 factor, ECF subfamily